MLKRLSRPSRARVSDCTRKRANATPVCAAAISASSPGWTRSVSVIRNDYRRDWHRATAEDRSARLLVMGDEQDCNGLTIRAADDGKTRPPRKCSNNKKFMFGMAEGRA